MQTRKFTKLNCAPKSNYKYTCYSKKRMFKLKQKFNKKYKSDNITKKSKYGIWKTLKKKLGHACGDERCWLDVLSNSNTLGNHIFSPDHPATWKNNPNEWLSTTDIDSVLQQYNKKYKNFVNISVSPSDFDKRVSGSCVDEQLCKFNLKNYLTKKIGVVFNNDPHYKDGSHWVAIFIYPKKKLLYYFDSTGNKPNRNINRFIKLVLNQGKQLNIKFNYKINKIKHQVRDTECGIYSLYFLITMLKSKHPKLFTTRISDDEISKYRKKYFNTPACKSCKNRICTCN